MRVLLGLSVRILGQRLLKFTAPRYTALPRRLREIQSGGARRAAAGAMKKAVEDLIQDQFERRAAPDGTPWAARKPPTGRWPLLEKTGRMRAGFEVHVTTTGLTVTNAREYLKFHQTGTSKMVARPVLPALGQLPPTWTGEIDARVESALDALFRVPEAM